MLKDSVCFAATLTQPTSGRDFSQSDQLIVVKFGVELPLDAFILRSKFQLNPTVGLAGIAAGIYLWFCLTVARREEEGVDWFDGFFSRHTMFRIFFSINLGV